MHEGIVLTSEEHHILDSYKGMIDGLASYLGSSYEIVLHSLEDPDHSIIKIINGFHTGRKEGQPLGEVGESMVERFTQGGKPVNSAVYFRKNNLGGPMKSTTIAIRSGERLIGMLCINLYLGTPLINFFDELTPKDTAVFAAEVFSDATPDTVVKELKQAKEQVWKDSAVLPSARNKEVIRILQKKRMFEIKNSVEQVAHELNISVNTVYFHLRNIAKAEETT